MLRPPIAQERLLQRPDGLVRIILKKAYADGTLAKPAGYASAFPDLLTFHDAPTPIENTLFVMFLEHRMRAFQGAFHMNPDYQHWYGWAEMKRDIAERGRTVATMLASPDLPRRDRVAMRVCTYSRCRRAANWKSLSDW